MKSLVFLPLNRGPTLAHCRSPQAVRIDATLGATELSLSGESNLAARSISSDKRSDDSAGVALLLSIAAGDDLAWHLIPRTADLHINGKRPLSLAALNAGDIVSIDGADWWAAELYSPQPIDPPAELAGKLCSICGNDLALPSIRVVKCSCGGFYHCESPDEPNNKDALNCYLQAATCGTCGQPCSMEPRLIPEGPAKLFDEPEVDDFDV